MDAIVNAVSDSCEPAIIPDITLQTIDSKTVIVVEVSEGRQLFWSSPMCWLGYNGGGSCVIVFLTA